MSRADAATSTSRHPTLTKVTKVAEGGRGERVTGEGEKVAGGNLEQLGGGSENLHPSS